MILDGAKCDHERGLLFRKAKGIDAVPEEPPAAGVGAHEPELEAFQPDAEWDLLAGDADTDDECETVGQVDGEPQAPEEAPAAHQVAVVVDSGEAPSEIVAPAPSIDLDPVTSMPLITEEHVQCARRLVDISVMIREVFRGSLMTPRMTAPH